MRQPWDDPVFRLLLAAPNGAMLLSEKLLATSTGPFQSEQHFAMSDLGNIFGAIEYYIANNDERCEIARQAFEFVTKELTMRNTAQRILVALDLRKADCAEALYPPEKGGQL